MPTAPRLETSRPCRLRGIAFIVPGFDAPESGPSRAARRVAEGMARQGVPVTYVTTSWPGAPAHEVLGIVQVFRAPADLLELTALALLAARRDRVDGVYGVHARTSSSLIALRVARALGVPIVVRLAAPLDDAAPARLLRAAARLTAPTPALARAAERALGLPPERVLEVPDGVDLEAFAPRPAPAGRKVVLVAPAADPSWEGAVWAASTRALATRPGLALQRQATSPPTELQRDAAAWVLPGHDHAPEDGLLEALAAGIPAVAAIGPGSSEVARDGEEALLVPPGDAEALARALARVLDDPALAATLTAGGRLRVQDAFDLEQVAARHAQLFEELKAARSSPASPGPALARAAIGALARTGRDATLTTVRALRGRLS